MSRRVLSASLAVAFAAACGGADIPQHNGYKSAKARPWQRPTVLELDEGLEAEVDDAVSYPKRQRARWYAVDLPTHGEMQVEMTVVGLADDREIDLAFEVMDEGYQTLAQADREEDDAGEEQKTRTVKGLAPGRYYIHVYAQRRLDEADFTLQVGFRGTAEDGGDTANPNFPATVAYITALPDIPAVDDAPAHVPEPTPQPVAKKCKGSRCKKKPEPRQPEAQPPPKAIRARIAGIVSVTSGGTLIRIDRGSQQGIKVGWKGSVVTSSGSAISGGAFEISKVTGGESFATVRATADSVTAAKYVRLRPP
jgi:hypothetical protein